MSTIGYVCFEPFPAPKGAGTHIAAFATALGREFGDVELVTLPPRSSSDGCQPTPFCADGVTWRALLPLGNDLIARCLSFRAMLLESWRGRRKRVVHIRSIFEGYPIAKDKGAYCDRLVFEVNGLPSIELKYHYPNVAADAELLRKLRAQERACLLAADLVVTPSAVTAEYLLTRGVDEHKIRVIPNGVTTNVFEYKLPRRCDGALTAPPGAPESARLLYSGTLASWQGLAVALETLARCLRVQPTELTVVGLARPDQLRLLRERAYDLGVLPHVNILDAMSQPAVAKLHHEHDVVLAPLAANDRNLVQGCCPLKVLEAMAAGTPLVASDIPAVRALAQPEREAVLVPPGCAQSMHAAIQRLLESPEHAAAISRRARARVEREFEWEMAQSKLVHAYESLGIMRRSTRRIAAVSDPN